MAKKEIFRSLPTFFKSLKETSSQSIKSCFSGVLKINFDRKIILIKVKIFGMFLIKTEVDIAFIVFF